MRENSVSTIAAAIRVQTSKTPNRVALITRERSYTYAELLDLTAVFATQFAQQGIRQESTVRIRVRDLAVVLPSALACALLGSRVVEWYPASDAQSELAISHDIVQKSRSEGTEHPKQISVDATYTSDFLTNSEKARIWQTAEEIDSGGIWYLASSPGFGSVQFYLGLSQRDFVNRAKLVLQSETADETRVVHLGAPMRYFPFIRSIAGLIQGHTIIENSDAAFWSKNRVTKITGWPGHIPELLAQQWQGFRVSQLEIFGGDISEDELSDLLSVFDEIEVTFDTASTGKIWSDWHRPAQIRGDTPSDQFFGATVEVLNDQGFEVDAGKVGILRIKTNVFVPLSVIHRAEGRNPVQGDWIYPGIIGLQDAENRIVILGHALDDVLSIQGKAIFGPEIDKFLKSISGIIDAVAFENPKSERGEILAFAIFQKGVNPYQKAELAKLETFEKLGEAFAPSIIRAVNAIPRTKEGFPDREACGVMIMMAAHREKSE